MCTKWSDMFAHGLVFQWATIKNATQSQCVGLVQSLAELEFDLKKFEFQLW
jgi:hypothetical protein